jgi:hypothetical protein
MTAAAPNLNSHRSPQSVWEKELCGAVLFVSAHQSVHGAVPIEMMDSFPASDAPRTQQRSREAVPSLMPEGRSLLLQSSANSPALQ